jgi:hypothetical protein
MAHLTNSTGWQYKSELILGARDQDISTFLDPESKLKPKLDFVGKFRETDVTGFIEVEHQTGRANENLDESRGSWRSQRPDYRAGIRNNCHDYVARILRAGGYR